MEKKMSFKNKTFLDNVGLDWNEYTVIRRTKDNIKVKEDKTGRVQDFRY